MTCKCSYEAARAGLCPHDLDDACDVGCVWAGEPHDGDCLTEDDVADQMLRSHDFDGWAAT